MKSRHGFQTPGVEILPDLTAVQWPRQSRLAVALTIDCYGSEATGAHHMVASTLDFGPKRGVPNILECLAGYGVKATFNVAGATAKAYPALLRTIVASGHDVGVLGNHFQPHWEMEEDEERAIVRDAVAAVADATGQMPRGWRTPQSRPSVNTLKLLTEAGMEWDSSLRNDEMPYTIAFEEKTLVEIPGGGSNDDTSYLGFPYPIIVADSVFSVWQDELCVLHEESSEKARMIVFSLTPGFVGRRTGLTLLRQVIDYAKALDGVWFATCSDISAFWNSNHYWKK